MSLSSDRRASVRFEAVGHLWASFEASGPARLVNIGRDGALIASRTACAVDSAFHFRIDPEATKLDARVRHVRAVTDQAGTTYLIGVEFLTRPEIILGVLAKLGLSTTEN